MTITARPSINEADLSVYVMAQDLDAAIAPTFVAHWGDKTSDQARAKYDTDGDGVKDTGYLHHAYAGDGDYALNVGEAQAPPAVSIHVEVHSDAAGGQRVVGGDEQDVVLGGSSHDRLTGGGADDALFGAAGDDMLSGGAGDDQLIGGAGRDLLRGGGGNDTLIGGAGLADLMSGGAGRDVFAFGTYKDQGGLGHDAERITDFTHGPDSIDLGGIAYELDTVLEFIGTERFHQRHDGYGQVRYEQRGDHTSVFIDALGDGHADREIRLDGLVDLTKGDFILY